MFYWWRQRKRSDPGITERPTASEVDTEYAEYLSRIRKALVLGASIGVFGTAVLYWWAWLSALSVDNRNSQDDQPSSPTIILDPLPATMTLAGFSLLAAVAIGLQLAVRTPSEAETRLATVLARRRFLCSVASFVVPATFALAAYATAQGLANAPLELDIVRIFGPGLCGILVALIAADAGVASDPDFAPAEMGRVWRARVARRLLNGLRMVGDRPTAVRARTNVWQVLVLVATPVLIALTSSLSAPDLTVRQRVLLMVIALVLAGIIYAIAVLVYISAVTRDWVAFASIIVIAAVFGALCWLMFAANILQLTAESRSLTPAMTTVTWAIIYVAAPAFLAAWSLVSFRDRRPRVLGLVVRGVLAKRLRQRHKGSKSVEQPAYNRVALVAPWLSVFLPFGLILGVIAKQQILRARQSPTASPQRGEWVANLAIGLTAFFVIALVACAVFIAAIDPQEWDEFIWR